MYKTTETGVKKVTLAIAKGLLRSGTLHDCRARVSTVLSGISWMDVRMKADVAQEADTLARSALLVAKTKPWELPWFIASRIDGVMKAFNRAYRKAWKRTARTYIGSQMKLQRGREEPVVFYLVSSHQKPQPAHEPLQGTILVDRYWNVVTDGDERIARYLKANKTHTLQWAMGAPCYLITRPKCRHYLIPLKTGEVVGSSLKAIRARHQRKPTHVHRPLTDAQRWQAYKALRNDVKGLIGNLMPVSNRIGLKKA